MHNTTEHIQIQYEIAMAIGADLDLRRMLKTSLSTILKKFNCSAGAVHLWADGLHGTPVYSIPRKVEKIQAYQAALKELTDYIEQSEANTPPFFIAGQTGQTGNYYGFDLPDVGFMILVKEGAPLPERSIKILHPLQGKLATAITACQQNQTVIDAYAKVTAYNAELIFASRHLEASRAELQDALSELRQTAAKNQAILNALPDSLLFLNENGDILDFKDAEAAGFLGLLAAAPPGQPQSLTIDYTRHNLFALLPPAVAALFRENISHTLTTGRLQTFDFEIQTPAGQRVFETRLVVNRRNEVLSIIRDITLRRQREEDVRILARFPAENPGPVLRVSREGNLLYANIPALPFAEDWGSQIGQPVPAGWRQLIERSFNQNESLHTEGISKNRVFSFVVTPVQEAGYANLYGVDITARKQAEEAVNTALIRTEALYRASSALNALDELPVLLQTIADYVAVALPADRVILITFDSQSRTVLDYIESGPGQQPIETIQFAELWEGLTGWVLRESQPALSPKGKPDPRESEAVRQRRHEFGSGSIVVVPLTFKDKAVGTLTAINRSDERDFDPHDMELMTTLANHAAAAIANAQLVESLQESELRMRTIIEAAPDAIITTDTKDQVELFNPAAEKIFGYSASEVLGKKVDMLMSMPHSARHAQYVNNYLKTGDAKIIGIGRQLWARRKNGEEFPIFLTISEMRINNRRVFTAIIRDITQLKLAEEALRRSEEQLSSTLASMDDLVFVLDRAGHFVDYYQPPSRPELYIPPEIFTGADFKAVLPPEMAEPLDRAGYLVKDTGVVQEFDYPLQMGPRELWFNAKVSARRDHDGQFDGVTVVVRDVTERYELDKLRDDFVSTVSHELRTPLASIMGWTETLLSEMPGALNSDQHRFLTIVEDSANRLNKLVEEILTVSRIQQGTLKLDKQEFLPFDAISGVLSMVSTLVEKKNIALTVQNNWPAAQFITGDKSRLEQVLINLLTNAIKFTPEHGQVWLRCNPEGDNWRVEVQDTGIGIPPADIPRMFDRFYRASNASEAKIQGTGLGLYICKAIIEAHDGQVELVSEEGQGTTVRFTVPAN